jgi:hypothetical protein
MLAVSRVPLSVIVPHLSGDRILHGVTTLRDMLTDRNSENDGITSGPESFHRSHQGSVGLLRGRVRLETLAVVRKDTHLLGSPFLQAIDLLNTSVTRSGRPLQLSLFIALPGRRKTGRDMKE